MNTVKMMLDSHPRKHVDIDMETLAACIEGCRECEIVCTVCADACLGEQEVQSLVHCIRLNQDCADLCRASLSLLSRQTEASPAIVAAQVGAMELACRLCAEECERHAQHHEHCRLCAEVCRRCEQACRHLAETFSVGIH